MLIKNKFSDLNSLWACLIVEELLRCGVKYFCIAPGSRSAPLAIAVAQNPHAKSIVHFDERSLGFYALGLCVETQSPIVVITTSGTAAANLFPSIIEANKKKLPLIILTADRPPELRATGANQTIDQIKIFGDYVRFFFDLPCPTRDIAAESILTTIDQAVFRAQGELPGPVHLNCMFREPLAPSQIKKNFSSYLKSIGNWQISLRPYTQYQKPDLRISDTAIEETAQILKTIKNGIIVVGKIGGTQEQKAVLALAQKLNWSIFADITSGLRLGQKQIHVIEHFEHILNTAILNKNTPVDGILHLGGRLTSSRFYQVIKKLPLKHYLMVLKHPLRNDPNHIVSMRLQSSVKDFCQALGPKISQRSPGRLLKNLCKADLACEKILNENLFPQSNLLTEPAVARLVSQLIPKNSGFFIGNSMPIRDLGLFASKQGESVKITANRGASGIDGNIATAAGFAKELDGPCTCVLGDLSFLYDLNSLSLLQNPHHPFVMIILNNNGGAIFSFLPVSNLKTGFDKFFTAPHNMTFEHAAKLFKLSYKAVKTITDFKQTYTSAIKTRATTIIEVISNPQSNFLCHQNIVQKIKNSLKNF